MNCFWAFETFWQDDSALLEIQTTKKKIKIRCPWKDVQVQVPLQGIASGTDSIRCVRRKYNGVHLKGGLPQERFKSLELGVNITKFKFLCKGLLQERILSVEFGDMITASRFIRPPYHGNRKPGRRWNNAEPRGNASAFGGDEATGSLSWFF